VAVKEYMEPVNTELQTLSPIQRCELPPEAAVTADSGATGTCG